MGDGDRSGTISVTAAGELIVTNGPTVDYNFALIGHGAAPGYDVLTASGRSDITIAAGNITLNGQIDAYDGMLTIGRSSAAASICSP